MGSKMTLPIITITCPKCGAERDTIVTPCAAIYWVCDGCGQVAKFVVVSESKAK
jgi:uncharacterized Zn finger protein